MKKPFAVGDRVRVYGSIHYASTGYIFNGIVDRISEPSGELGVKPHGDSSIYYVCAKQCRRLVKKERRKLYAIIPSYSVQHVDAYFDRTKATYACHKLADTEVVEFVEARPKKGSTK